MNIPVENMTPAPFAQLFPFLQDCKWLYILNNRVVPAKADGTLMLEHSRTITVLLAGRPMSESILGWLLDSELRSSRIDSVAAIAARFLTEHFEVRLKIKLD